MNFPCLFNMRCMINRETCNFSRQGDAISGKRKKSTRSRPYYSLTRFTRNKSMRDTSGVTLSMLYLNTVNNKHFMHAFYILGKYYCWVQMRAPLVYIDANCHFIVRISQIFNWENVTKVCNLIHRFDQKYFIKFRIYACSAINYNI